MIDIKDEILSGESSYRIRDKQGNIVQDEVSIEQITPVIQEGTPLNKALLNNLQGDLYTVDRYNKPVTAIVNKKITISASSNIGGAFRVLDGNDGSYWSTTTVPTSSSPQWLDIHYEEPNTVSKFSITLPSTSNANCPTAWEIKAKKDDGDWVVLYTQSSVVGDTITVDTENKEPYNYYRIEITAVVNNNNGLIYTFKPLDGTYDTPIFDSNEKELDFGVFNLNLPLTSYEVGKIVNIEPNSLDVFIDDTTQTTNIFPTSGWTDISTGNAHDKTLYTKYTSNDYILESSSSRVEGEGANNACDNSSSGWNSKGTTEQEWIKMTCPAPTKITKMSTWVTAYGNTSGFKKAVIQGSKDDSNWVNLSTLSTYQTEKTELALENTDYYTYYRIVVDISYFNANVGVCVKYWEVAEWIEGLHTKTITSFGNPSLNINNLGAKQINGTIASGAKYNLVYNGESWDIAPTGVTVVTGSFGASSSKKTLNLGFTPDIVIAYATYNNYGTIAVSKNSADYYYVPRILTKALISVYGSIIENGFDFSSSLMSGSYGTVYYIAIKF